ncbi:LacI family DNA-binding transcriptional regulator [Tessaracoccus sp. G1721]
MSTQSRSPKRVTAADVARSLGLSRATVGFVLNDTPGQTIPAPTRERVLAEAERLGYRPHSAARALASGRSHIVLLVLPDWPLDFTLRRNIEEASLALDASGYSLITYTPEHASHTRPLWESLQPDVVISMTPLAPERIAAIRAAGVEHIVPDPDHADVEQYREEGPSLQVSLLQARGVTRVAFVGSTDPRIADLVAARRASATEAAAAVGLRLAEPLDIELTEDSAAAAVRTLIGEGVTGVAAYNDEVALALVGAALRAGVDVPGELAVVGHDDAPFAALAQPRLTTIRLDVTGLGRYLASIALNLAEGTPLAEPMPVQHVALVVRDTA